MTPVSKPADTAQMASFGKRVAARALDTALKAVAATAAVILIRPFLKWFDDNFWSSTGSEPLRGSALVGFLAVGVIGLAIPFYEIAMVAARGQTIGKMVVNIKVVRLDYPRVETVLGVDGVTDIKLPHLDSSSAPGLGPAIGRWFLPVAAFWFGLILSVVIVALIGDSMSTSTVWLALARLALLLPPTLWLMVHLSALWDRQRRGWHDYLAGTRVVDA